MEVKVKIHGGREIASALNALPRRMDRRVLNRSLLKGAKPIVEDARGRAPVLATPDPRRRAGALRRAIRAGAVRPLEHTATVYVRVRGLTRAQIRRFKASVASGKRKAGNNPNDAFYWRFVEFGTSKMPARPFLRPAFEGRKGEFLKIAIADMRERVQAEIVKLRVMPRI